jgi:RND family efflux transporter MFP subunit
MFLTIDSESEGLDAPLCAAPFRRENDGGEGATLPVDAETRNMRTEVDLPNPNEVLYPGMYAQVSLETDRHPHALTLPASAIVSDAGGAFVNVVQDSHVKRQPVKTGMTEGGLVEIIDGLADDAQVVTTGKSAPPAGTAVQAVLHDAP